MNPAPPAIDPARRDKIAAIRTVIREVERVIVGQRDLIERVLIGLLAGGHVLLEGVPGLAKTTLAKTLAQALQTDFGRVQFTPDLLPADLIGTQIYTARTGEFTVRKGPVFTHILLADEINRAPAKVQSALLEAMQERQVTIGDTTFPLPDPFFVIATQNPIEHEGTYPLPEAQLDRFLLKAVMDYPSEREERAILDRMATTRPPAEVDAVMPVATILQLRQEVDTVYIDPTLRDYIVRLVRATRPDPGRSGSSSSRVDSGDNGARSDDRTWRAAGLIAYGASPRATIALALAAKAHALLRDRDYTLPVDIQAVAPDVLRHRIVLTYEAEAEERDATSLICRILAAVEVP